MSLKDALSLMMLALFLLFFGENHASDKEIINSLNRHEKEFYKLIEMFGEDSPATVIHPHWISTENSITEKRWEEYKKYFVN
ncbi:hypothetical protein LJC22_03820 [Desulfosarcina sp. OttesenSCG-928-G10]|nr:hypothetical protein [Desulfosarcina sp. OttesenSCG-928-G10]